MPHTWPNYPEAKMSPSKNDFMASVEFFNNKHILPHLLQNFLTKYNTHIAVLPLFQWTRGSRKIAHPTRAETYDTTIWFPIMELSETANDTATRLSPKFHELLPCSSKTFFQEYLQHKLNISKRNASWKFAVREIFVKRQLFHIAQQFIIQKHLNLS
jgi:hypothetical protein